MCYTCIVVRIRAPHRGVHGHLENGRAAVNHIHLSKTAFKNEPKHAFKNEPKHAFKNDHLPVLGAKVMVRNQNDNNVRVSALLCRISNNHGSGPSLEDCLLNRPQRPFHDFWKDDKSRQQALRTGNSCLPLANLDRLEKFEGNRRQPHFTCNAAENRLAVEAVSRVPVGKGGSPSSQHFCCMLGLWLFCEELRSLAKSKDST